MSEPEPADRELAMSTAAFDEHDRLQAEAHDLAKRAGHAYDEHWRHQSVLWAQGLLERYGHVSIAAAEGLGRNSAWRGRVGGYFWETNVGMGATDDARIAAEAIVPEVSE